MRTEILFQKPGILPFLHSLDLPEPESFTSSRETNILKRLKHKLLKTKKTFSAQCQVFGWCARVSRFTHKHCRLNFERSECIEKWASKERFKVLVQTGATTDQVLGTKCWTDHDKSQWGGRVVLRVDSLSKVLLKLRTNPIHSLVQSD